ncbi:hypothetical protein A0H81_03309 [Grifola frondosa]|uniref:F-box domain-containing protein n=1 Tax=Grifola frondosa TaxID=5627 RepID=A0A1C7MIK1_GRIFR|nr:hypothetical protein A0H81_03309 [Grifola frondosa]
MATLAGLLPFAVHCPKLRCLHIEVNATGQSWPCAEIIPTPSCRLHQLNLSGSPIDCPYAVVDFLLRVFLAVEDIWFDVLTAGCYQNHALMRAWKEVRRALIQDNTTDT